MEPAEMNGTYRKFMNFIRAATTGLLKEIPIVGPMIHSVLEEMRQQQPTPEMQRLTNLLERILEEKTNLALAGIDPEKLRLDLSGIVDDEESANLASTILLAEAEAGNRLATKVATPKNRFLYLAADNYADSTKTLEIGAQLGFLWRSYHAKRKNPNEKPAIAHV
jgi:hypothetical protein